MLSLTERIRGFAQQIGFDLVGFTPADSLPEHQKALETWLLRGYAGEMAYMARDPSRRANPRQILPEAKTIICLAMNYYPGDHPPIDRPPHINARISRYAWGRDYHHVIEEKMDQLEAFIEDTAGRPLKIKRYVDHGPVLERAHASRAGLGFIGKNTLLITPEFGSWVFLAELITDLELEVDYPQPRANGFLSDCGNCSLCIEACPTHAIVAPFQLDAQRCISYLTIENKGEIPADLCHLMEDWIFGCDVCQQVCPYNRQAVLSKNPDLANGVGPWLDTGEILEMDQTAFKIRFEDTPLLRSKHSGLQRNAKIVIENTGHTQERPRRIKA